MKSILSGILSVSALLIAACDSDSTRPETGDMEVMPYLQPCTGVGPMSCMTVKDAAVDTTAGLFYNGIEGFKFQWDRRCLISVEKIPVKDPPADGSSIRYVLEGTPNCTPSTQWSFQAFFNGSDGHVSGDTLLIDGYAKPIRILDQADRNSLAALREKRVTLTVEPGEGNWLKGHSVRELVMQSQAP